MITSFLLTSVLATSMAVLPLKSLLFCGGESTKQATHIKKGMVRVHNEGVRIGGATTTTTTTTTTKTMPTTTMGHMKRST